MLDFIDSTGEAFAFEIISSLDSNSRIVIFAGPELNGAYALAAARHLTLQGYAPEVYLFNIGGNRANQECVAMRDRFIAECETSRLDEVVSMQFAMPELENDVLFIDGLFGTERTTPLPGGYQAIVRYVNERGVRVISLDVPSGMLVDSLEGMINRNIIHATKTLAIGVPRVAFFLKDNAELLGVWKVVHADYSKRALDQAPSMYTLVDRRDIARIIPERDAFASKADCGDAILFAGSYGMLGASILAAKGALRAGVGKLTVRGPRCGFYALQTAVPCALFECSPSDELAITHIELRKQYDAVAIGPGIGTADVTINALDAFLKIANANSRPVVLDADALNCIAIRPSMLNHIPVMSIITPHEGEFDRLFGRQPSSNARLMKAIDEAQRRRIIIILKGRYTAIVRPDGKVYFNPTGNAALATAGSGDVLTGVILAFLAQGMRPEFAAVAAPFVHGLAGENASKLHGIFGTTAEDVAEGIGRAIKSIMEQ